MPADSSETPMVPDPADEIAALRAGREELLAAVAHWRAKALEGWAEPQTAGAPVAELAAARAQAEHWHGEVMAMRRTLSWRITRPLRSVRGVGR